VAAIVTIGCKIPPQSAGTSHPDLGYHARRCGPASVTDDTLTRAVWLDRVLCGADNCAARCVQTWNAHHGRACTGRKPPWRAS